MPGIRRAIDVVLENPVVSTVFLAQHLQLSVSRASKLVRQLVEVGILTPATGKYRKSQLYQADDILSLTRGREFRRMQT
jgi:ribosomal protein S25